MVVTYFLMCLNWNNFILLDLHLLLVLVLVLKVNSSSDGQLWDGFQSVTGSGGVIPNKRFIRIEFILECNGTHLVPVVNNFTLSYINKDSKYDLVKLCDVYSEISGSNYIGKYYFVDGDDLRMYDGIDTYKIVEPTPGFTDPSPAKIGKLFMHTTKSESAFSGVNLDSFNGGVDYNQTIAKIWYEPCQLELDDSFNGKNVIPKNPKYICLQGNVYFW